jgi:hypothetical protein
MATMNSCCDHILDFWICVSPGPLVHDYYEASGIVKVNAGASPVGVDVQISHPSCSGKAHVGGWCFWRGGKVSFSAYIHSPVILPSSCPRRCICKWQRLVRVLLTRIVSGAPSGDTKKSGIDVGWCDHVYFRGFRNCSLRGVWPGIPNIKRDDEGTPYHLAVLVNNLRTPKEEEEEEEERVLVHRR